MASDSDEDARNETLEQYETGGDPGILEEIRRNAVDSRLATQERVMSISDGMHAARDVEDTGQ